MRALSAKVGRGQAWSRACRSSTVDARGCGTVWKQGEGEAEGLTVVVGYGAAGVEEVDGDDGDVEEAVR